MNREDKIEAIEEYLKTFPLKMETYRINEEDLSTVANNIFDILERIDNDKENN